jgi:site-specific DNA-methyltransferase (adenine-specific)
MIQQRIDNVYPRDIILPSDYSPPQEDLQGMIESLKSNGLFHSPIIKENMEIVAGKLRVLAARSAWMEGVTINCTIIPNDLDPEEYKIISLQENLKRHNLPWDEQIIQEKELHDIRQSQYGIGKRGKKVGWSLRDTAAELDIALGTLSEDLRMADVILMDPTLRRIGDKMTARRVIFERIKRIDQESNAGMLVTNIEYNKCYLGDSGVILQQYPDNSFDACITDPPWLEFASDKALTKDEFTFPVFKEVFRVLKPNSFLYAFVSTQDWHIYFEQFKAIGFNVQKYPLIWVKEGVLTLGTRTWEYQRDYEPILLAVKGSPALTSSMQSSIMSCKVVPSQKLVHPNEKPETVIKRILDQCTYEGSIVLDPFAGSFVVPATCKATRRRYVAIEKEPKYFAQGELRCK